MATRSNRDHNQGETQAHAPMPLPGKRGLTTRSRNVNDQNYDPGATKIRNKRKAEDSPLKKTTKLKRSALGNLTNASVMYAPEPPQPTKNLLKKTVLSNFNNNNTNQPKSANQKGSIGKGILLPPTVVPRSTKILTRAAMKNNALAARAHMTLEPVESSTHKAADHNQLHVAETVVKRESLVPAAKPTTRRISNEFQSDDSMYMTALEDTSENLSDSNQIILPPVPKTRTVQQKPNVYEANRIQSPDLGTHVVPSNVIDFDKENWDDPFQVSHYALDIFRYLKEREEHFPIGDYIMKQVSLTKWMRSLLVDWMVEVQESFELNHETLYLAVKIVDLYLTKETISKDSLQLLGAAALFLSSKYEENNPPLTEDFLYICDGAYTDKQLIRMEKLVFRTINFNLGIPLSYRFLRRYARAAKIPMSTLTLARYILELSLMDYATIQFLDSKSAAAALFIALRMNNESGWNHTLEFYSGYKIEDFMNIVLAFNAIVARKPKDPINTIRKKYSHSVFLSVAKIPLKSNSELLSELTPC